MRTWEIAIAASLGAFAWACDTADGTEGSSCPNTNNCIMPLVCIDNICQQPPAERDGGAPPRDGGVVRDGGPPRDGGIEYDQAFNGGSFTVTPAGTTAGFDQMTGTAAMVREDTGYTDVRVEVAGLTPDTTFATHVHDAPCNDNGGGPHYKIDEMEMDTIESNEIWPNIDVNTDGDGVGLIRVNHYARPSATSVVIHEPMMAERIACADLSPNADLTGSGTFVELAAGVGRGITGTAELRRYPGGTQASVTLMGNLTADTTYPIHVHASPCDVNNGGPHYKIDADENETIEENEIWPSATADGTGTMAMGTATTPHIARFEAASLVVHDPDNGDRLLCADLWW
ncbi:MAG: hypothetical protein RIT81_42000 [Deltaproteobacteria bacterium]